MKKRFILLSLMTIGACFCWAQKPEITTSKSKRVFKSTIQLEINASCKATESVIDKFIEQYNHDLPSLFNWALRGLKLRGEKDDFIEFNIKSHAYDALNHVVNGNMDINILMTKSKFTDVKYKTTLTKTTPAENQIVMNYEMMECESVIDYASTEINIQQTSPDVVLCTFNVSFKLVRPYSLMTTKMYKENIEWRFVKLLTNIKQEAEKK